MLRSHLVIAAMGTIFLIITLVLVGDAQRRTAQVSGEISDRLRAAQQIHDGLLDATLAMRGWVVLDDMAFRRSWLDAWRTQIYPAFVRLSWDDQDGTSGRPGLISRETEQDLAALYDLQWWVMEVAHQPGNEPWQYHHDIVVHPTLANLDRMLAYYGWTQSQAEGIDSAELNAAIDGIQLDLARLEARVEPGWNERGTQSGIDSNIGSVESIHARFVALAERYPADRNDVARLMARIERELTAFGLAYTDQQHLVASEPENIAKYRMTARTIPLTERMMAVLDDLGSAIKAQKDEELERAAATAYITVILLIVMIAVTLLVAWVVSTRGARRITSPISALLGAIQRVARGDAPDALPVSGIRELDSLAESFIEMGLALIQSQRRLEEMNTALDERVRKRTQALTEANSQLNLALLELKNTQEQMVQTEKLAAVGTLAAGIAHEINNPLMGIMNYLEYVAARVTDERLHEILLRARREVSNLERIVEQLLAHDLLGGATVGKVVLQDDLRESVEMLSMQMVDQGVQWSFDLPADLPPVRGSAASLRQVLINLVLNALHAVEGRSDRAIAVRAYERAEEICIEVRDNGPGVSPINRSRIFDPFFTTRPTGEGTGLGLYVSGTILAQFGGSMELLDGSDPGATFLIHLEKYMQ